MKEGVVMLKIGYEMLGATHALKMIPAAERLLKTSIIERRIT